MRPEASCTPTTAWACTQAELLVDHTSYYLLMSSFLKVRLVFTVAHYNSNNQLAAYQVASNYYIHLKIKTYNDISLICGTETA